MKYVNVIRDIIIIIVIAVSLTVDSNGAKITKERELKIEELDPVSYYKLDKIKRNIKLTYDIRNIEFIPTVKEDKPVLVYQNLTMDEVIDKLNKNLNSNLSGTGGIFAEYSLQMNVDPFLVVAITLLETGCYWECSRLVKYCNNVGGMVGYGCNGFAGFSSLEEGIRYHINNIYYGYVSVGLTTPELMNQKYAEDKTWASKVNSYIDQLKNN